MQTESHGGVPLLLFSRPPPARASAPVVCILCLCQGLLHTLFPNACTLQSFLREKVPLPLDVTCRCNVNVFGVGFFIQVNRWKRSQERGLCMSQPMVLSIPHRRAKEGISVLTELEPRKGPDGPSPQPVKLLQGNRHPVPLRSEGSCFAP